MVTNVILLCLVILMILMINWMYSVYHIFMRKKVEFASRLLNVLYSHLAIWLQIGSFINLFIVIQDFEFFNFGKFIFVIYALRYLQLMMIFLYFFIISITTNIHNFKSSIYLYLSFLLNGVMVFFCLMFVGYIQFNLGKLIDTYF